MRSNSTTSIINRRALIAQGSVAILAVGLTRCATTSGGVPLEQLKAYADAAIGAVGAAAQEFLVASPSSSLTPLVNAAINDLQIAKTALDGVVAESDARSIALEVVAVLTQLLPIVTPFLGPAGPFVPVALAVINAFVASLPAPANTPPVPPAALVAKAKAFRR